MKTSTNIFVYHKTLWQLLQRFSVIIYEINKTIQNFMPILEDCRNSLYCKNLNDHNSLQIVISQTVYHCFIPLISQTNMQARLEPTRVQPLEKCPPKVCARTPVRKYQSRFDSTKHSSLLRSKFYNKDPSFVLSRH